MAYFFCGLHENLEDPWYGPNGLIRSLSLQLFMKLVELDILDLSFIDDRLYLQMLEEHELETSAACLFLSSHSFRGERHFLFG